MLFHIIPQSPGKFRIQHIQLPCHHFYIILHRRIVIVYAAIDAGTDAAFRTPRHLRYHSGQCLDIGVLGRKRHTQQALEENDQLAVGEL